MHAKRHTGPRTHHTPSGAYVFDSKFKFRVIIYLKYLYITDMTSVELRKLNMYPEWRTQQGYDDVFTYVQSIQNNQPPIFPAGFNARQRQRFQQKFGTDFRLLAQGQNPNAFDLVYRPALANNPNQHRVSLTVVPLPQRQQVLQDVFDDRRAGYGVGINLFYSRVCLYYLGINRDTCVAFLKTQGDYNVARPIRRIINKPILAKTSNERWCCDIVHMSRYYRNAGNIFDAPQFNANGNQYQSNFKYIFTCVDYFSGYFWAKAIPNLQDQTVLNALNFICTHIIPPTYPHILQCDNGHEFVNANFAAWCNQNNINLIHTTSYNPATNGKIERANETLRQKIKDGFIRNNNLQWVRYLPDYVHNMNTSKKTRTKFTPIELYTPQYIPPPNNLVNFNQNINDHSDIKDIRKEAQANSIRSANKAIQRGIPPTVFQVGDRCRIKIFAIDGDMRERYKESRGIQFNALRYTPDVFEVVNIVAPPPPPNLQAVAPQGQVWNVIRAKYIIRPVLANGQLGQPVANQNNVPREFFGSDLLKISNPEVPTSIPDRNRARQINRFIGLDGANNPNQPQNQPPQNQPPQNQPPQNQPLHQPLQNQPPNPPQNPNGRQPRPRQQNQFLEGHHVERQVVIPRPNRQRQQAPIANPQLEVRQNRPQRQRNPSQLVGNNQAPPRVRHFEPFGRRR